MLPSRHLTSVQFMHNNFAKKASVRSVRLPSPQRHYGCRYPVQEAAAHHRGAGILFGTAHWLLMSLSAYAALTRARSHTPSGAGIATSGSSSVMSIPYGRKFGEIAHTGEDEYERHEQEKKLKEYVGKISLGSSKYSV